MSNKWMTGKTIVGAIIAALGIVLPALGIDFDTAQFSESIFKVMEGVGYLLTVIGVRHAIAKSTE